MTKKFSYNKKVKLKQKTQGRCGMCYYYPSDLTGLEIAHIIPKFIEKIDNEFNAISLCTRCHTIYDSTVISVLKSGYTKEDKWWKNTNKIDKAILKRKRNKNYKDALKQIQQIRDIKKMLLIQNGVFSSLELDVLCSLFVIHQEQLLKTSNLNQQKDVQNENLINVNNKIVDELCKEYGKELFTKKSFLLKNQTEQSINIFGLEIQYHDIIHFKNLINYGFIQKKHYQSELLGNQRNLISSSGMSPSGEYLKPDRILLYYNDNDDTNNFCKNLFMELKDVISSYDDMQNK